MKLRALAAPLGLAAAAASLTGCAVAKTTCTVRHHYAIVIFQNGIGSNRPKHLTSFELNLRYQGGGMQHWPMRTQVTLRPANGGNPPLIVKTYRVGNASSCSVNHVRSHK
jgi:hypothetical protein